MKVSAHLEYVVLVPETELEGELLSKWFEMKAWTNSCTFGDGSIISLSISFKGEKNATNP